MNNILSLTRLLLCVFLTSVISCNQSEAPDVSGIPVNVKIERFDQFLFEQIDTTSAGKIFVQMQAAYPGFANDFIVHILGLPPVSQPVHDSISGFAFSELQRFIQLTRPVYDSISLKFRKTEELQKELKLAFKYVRYYYPEYKVPQVITYVGPFNAPGVAITSNAIAIGLQLFAGKDFSYYTSQQAQELFPLYISRTFEPAYISVNCMKAVAGDLHSDDSRGKPMIEQMIEKGKQWYLANQFLPGYADSLLTGYTQQQLIWCRENEGLIWNFFLQSTDIYTTEQSIIKDYIGEAPTTPGMPDSSPGNIGQWVGWQIVKKYAEKNTDIKPVDIMKTEAKEIFAVSKYKPR